MSDDEPDLELLELLRQHIHGKLNLNDEPETGVLADAEYVYDNSTDVALDMRCTKNAAAAIYDQMQERGYSTDAWHDNELHPRVEDFGEEATVAFVFTMDLLNFCFWSELPEGERYAVEYKGKTWTGYWSLIAAMRRALDEGIPITRSDFWQNEDECTLESLGQVFRSSTDEPMPLLSQRLNILREAGTVLYERYQCSFMNVIKAANGSAAGLVNLLARDFPCFRDEHRWEGRRKPVRFLKRAQILVADLWACFRGEGPGAFRDTDKITMFADYRVPQVLHSLGCLYYCPPLEAVVRGKKEIESGGSYEMQIRACSIWCVELLRREIIRAHPETKVNAILIDFFLYDLAKRREAEGKETAPHHRTRTVWY